jgi:hypothetical protein
MRPKRTENLFASTGILQLDFFNEPRGGFLLIMALLNYSLDFRYNALSCFEKSSRHPAYIFAFEGRHRKSVMLSQKEKHHAFLFV